MNIIAGLTAFFLGAIHALEPGHGKSAIAAYAVGYQGGFRHIFVLGLTTAVAHTATILVLALIVGAAVSSIAEDEARRYVEIGSAFLLLATGAWLWRRAVVNRRKTSDCAGEECACRRKNAETSENGQRVSYGVVGLLGISTGILPCPTALAVLISAMTAGHFAGGIWTVCLFSTGIALTMCAIALAAFLFANSALMKRFQNFSGRSGWAKHLPVFSAWIIIGSGVFTLFRAFYHS